VALSVFGSRSEGIYIFPSPLEILPERKAN